MKSHLLFALAIVSLKPSFAVACVVGNNFTNGYTMPTMSATTLNINKYETDFGNSALSAREVAATNYDIFRVYDNCTTGLNRGIYGNIHGANVTTYKNNIYRLTANPSLGIKVEMADAPVAANFQTLGTSESLIYTYAGDSHGVKLKVTIYILPKTSTMTSYPATIPISNLRIATISLRRMNNAQLIPTTNGQIPVYLNATINISEATCSLNQSNYTIALPEISARNLGIVGEETSTSGNTATLQINCAYLNNGNMREVKAYMTDVLNQSNSSNILTNQTGANYATGVGIRLRDKDDKIISLDPNQSKTTNKWTFGALSTSQTIQHTIKANYIKTANTVTPGLVYSQAYLNLVYD